jgi:flavoprotein
MVIGANKRVYFNCRRVGPEKKVFVGQLEDIEFLESPMTIEDMESFVPDISLFSKMNIPILPSDDKPYIPNVPIFKKEIPLPVCKNNCVDLAPMLDMYTHQSKSYSQRINNAREISCKIQAVKDNKKSIRVKTKERKKDFISNIDPRAVMHKADKILNVYR